MITNLPGRLRNTDLPKAHALLPVYEAVINSIHSIEDAVTPITNGIITVEIIRDRQMILENVGAALPRIIGFTITDNGCGFIEENFSSFDTLDSDRKAAKGGKGIGRLMWLKAFERVRVESDFQKDGKIFRRTFDFDATNGISNHNLVESTSTTNSGTRVILSKYKKAYLENCPKSGDKIADSLFEHCLWFFIREEGCPQIHVKDTDFKYHLNKTFNEHVSSCMQRERFDIKENEFCITHVRLRDKSFKKHLIALCADGRLVETEDITGKIPGLYGRISDEMGDYCYGCYVTSKYLNAHVRSERTGFNLADKEKYLFGDCMISKPDIRTAVVSKAETFLGKDLDENKRRATEKISKFVNEVSPRYKPIVNRIPEQSKFIDPDITENDLELHLHKQFADFERQVIIEGQASLKPKADEKSEEYQKRVQAYLEKVEDIKKSDLASYVSHRRVVIDLLALAVAKDNNGNYSREALIHQLIMPMRKDSTQIEDGDSNLWLIDERLAFHDYLASDKTLNSMPITGSDSRKEPDLCGLRLFDNPTLVSDSLTPPFGSLTIVEIKRPMRNDAVTGEDKDPIEQCLGYLKRIRDGGVMTSNGRPLGNGNNAPGFCYIICDLTPSIIERCRMKNFDMTYDGLGYFGYNKPYCAYIEVISFDRLINQAKERNRAFFDKLGLPAT